MKEWAFEHYIITPLFLYLCLEVAAKVVSRTYRVIMVLCRGWPTHPNMDADGDIVLGKVIRSGE